MKLAPFRGYIQLNVKLIQMYGRCGSMRDAHKVFDRVPKRNLSLLQVTSFRFIVLC
ncbi:putative pentatricopeptide [Rosa chinensis]|uniref:Putative pentatricopeptide n=1 Tax=Rosa chinensis TaxID=74649 RepID=A0A2P6PPB4_ROSCH|nr:putative pentatricopeptide [Rosa chinensis]